MTQFGGATSHAALVARQMGKVCIVGCSVLDIDYERDSSTSGDVVIKEGDWISIDGTSGRDVPRSHRDEALGDRAGPDPEDDASRGLEALRDSSSGCLTGPTSGAG